MESATGATPAVSVVVRAFNRERYIGETIRSILGQTYQDFEILVVDDGSTDGTRAVVELLDDPRIRYVYQPNQGPSAALNEGVRHARGTYLAILDSDDVWLPHMMATAVETLRACPAAGLFYGQATSIDERGEPLGPIQGAPLKYPGDPFRSLLSGDVVSPATAVMRRECLRRVGEFDTTLNGVEDWDMWLRIARHYPVVYHPGVLARYRYHTASLTGARSNTGHLQAARVRVLDKALAAPDHAPDQQRLRRLAYRNVYLDVGLRAGRMGDRATALRYLAKAVRVAPDPAIAVLRIVGLYLFLRFLSRHPWTSRAIAGLVALRRR